MPANTITYDQDLLIDFEAGIDPLDPERGRIPAQVLGFGEMSTVMTISGADPDLVFKRMPMFYNMSELEPYLELYESYLLHLTNAGINVIPAEITSVVPEQGNIVVYIIQTKLDSRTLVNQALHTCTPDQIEKLFAAILRCVGQVFDYNDDNEDAVALGFDAQMSNWAVVDYDPDTGRLPESLELFYLDTSSPLMCLNGQEQCDPELFLRSAPSFMRWIIRLLFLDDVMTRYYDRRQVIVDILGNLYKEKRTDMIPALLKTANQFLSELEHKSDFQPITPNEIESYYKEDARIWSIYLSFRRLDRRMHRFLGRPYPYVLPGHVDR